MGDKAAKLRYKESGKQKETITKYTNSPHGRKVRSETQIAYRKTSEGKRALRKDILKRKYGITIEEYDDMMEKQNGLCAICFQKDADKRLAIDHCHTSNIVRGLLCAKCNVALGLFADDTHRLQRAIEYLQ